MSDPTTRDVIKYGPATLAALERELDEPVLFDAHALIAATEWRETLAANLATAAGCALAWRLRRDFGSSWEHGDCDAWCPNLDGVAAPGWER
jgi:hypothetical protein